jgi:hypothetical protein
VRVCEQPSGTRRKATTNLILFFFAPISRMFSSATNPIPTTYVLTESFCIAFCMKWPMSVSTVMYLVSLRTATMDMIHASARIFFVMWLMANRYATMHIKTVSYKRTEGRQKRGKAARWW